MEGGSRGAVLRVKRKRSAEPAEALVLACKRPRGGGAEPAGAPQGPGGAAAAGSVFRLVATVRSAEEPLQPLVRAAAAALRPASSSEQRVRHQLRAAARSARREGRYRVVSGRRALGEPSADRDPDPDRDPAIAIAPGDPHAAGLQLLDLVREEEGDAEAAGAGLPRAPSNPDAILCNSIELIRERLTLAEDGPAVGPPEEQKDDYVYDIYYLETATPGWIENVLSVQPYSQEWELVSDDQPSEDTYEDDDDDENSENNWRNEYPDEEDSDGEDSRGSLDYSSSSEDERGHSRPQLWSKYPLDVQKEFGYDSPDELD